MRTRSFRRSKNKKHSNSVRKRCSCMMCGNTRFWWGRTLQEKKARTIQEYINGN